MVLLDDRVALWVRDPYREGQQVTATIGLATMAAHRGQLDDVVLGSNHTWASRVAAHRPHRGHRRRRLHRGRHLVDGMQHGPHRAGDRRLDRPAW